MSERIEVCLHYLRCQLVVGRRRRAATAAACCAANNGKVGGRAKAVVITASTY